MRKQIIGNIGIATLIAVNILLWLVFALQSNLYPRSASQVFAEMLSSSGLILMACALLLSNKPRLLEPYFGGLDRMYVTHKTIALLGVILIVFHQMLVPKSGKTGPGLWLGMAAFAGILGLVLITVGPRVPLLSRFTGFSYHGWRRLHKFVGLFFIFGFIHMLMVEPLLLHSPILTGYIVTIATIGVLAYLYKEFLWDRLRLRKPYAVERITKLNGTTAEVVLKPQSEKMDYRAGQFLFVHFEGDPLLAEPHPFTISSAPRMDNLHLSIKACGDWTGYLHENLKSGTLARVDGPYGLFNYKTGSKEQLWIAGGIGITPFLSWIRDFNGSSDHAIDFFYTVNVPAEALFLDEIEKASTGRKNFRAHVSFSSQDGRLSVKKIVETSGAVSGKEVYLCGPFAMVQAFRTALIQQGAAAQNIHYEEFNFPVKPMISEISAKTLLSSVKQPDPWFGLKYNLNLYRGCQHQCIYCDSRSECYRIENFADILVKVNAIELLDNELRRKRIKGTIGTGSMNDPYMPLESTRNLTGRALEVIAAHAFPVHVITKGTLVLRDLPTLKTTSRTYAAVSFTITTAADDLGKQLEPGAPKVSERFAAMQKLSSEGILTGVTMMPILPFLEDNEQNIRQIVEKAAASGAKYILPAFGVTLRDRQRVYFYAQLDQKFPGLKEKYIRAFGERYYASAQNAKHLEAIFTELCEKHGIATKMPFYTPEFATQAKLF